METWKGSPNQPALAGAVQLQLLAVPASFTLTRTTIITQPESYFTHVVLGSYFIYDGSSIIQVFSLLFNFGMVI
jgi:hypothetical protein